MNTHYPKLFSPLTIPRRFELKNRAIMAPLMMNFEKDHPVNVKGPDDNYHHTMAAFYAARARADVGLIISGGISPSYFGSWYPGAPKLTTEKEAEKYRVVTDAVHKEGGRIYLQAFHAGRSAIGKLQVSSTSAQTQVGPFKPDERTQISIPSFMINYVVSEYERFAQLAELAGADGIEIPVSDGSLLQDFFSKAINDRTDKFGGSVENRAEIVMRVLDTVKSSLKNPDNFGISVRLCVHDLHPNGNAMSDTKFLAAAIAEHGTADIITTSVGLHDSPVHHSASYVPRAAFARSVKTVRDHLRANKYEIPISAAHRINSPEVAEKLIRDGVCDAVSIGRSLLADSNFITNAKEGNAEDSVPCIGCMGCTNKLFKDQRVGCSVNPFSGFETERTLTATKFPRTFAVVGGGPAGITAALTLAERGHKVVLYEKSGELGGQLNYAKIIPGKEEYYEIIKFWVRCLRKSNVVVRLNAEFGEKEVARLHTAYAAVVFCVGSQPEKFNDSILQGITRTKMSVLWLDVLKQAVIPGRRVCILGNGAIAWDVASYLLHDHKVCKDPERYCEEWGVDLENGTVHTSEWKESLRNNREVTIVQKAEKDSDLVKGRGWFQKLWLGNHDGCAIAHLTWAKVDDEGIQFRDARQTTTGVATRPTLKSDTVISATGMIPNFKEGTWLHEHVKDGARSRGSLPADFSVYFAGTCRDAQSGEGHGEQDLMKAVFEGFDTGAKA